MASLYSPEVRTISEMAKIIHHRAEPGARCYTDQASASLYRALSAGPKIKAREVLPDGLEFVENRENRTFTYGWRGAPYLESHKVVLRAREDQDMDVLLELCHEQDTDTAYLATYLTHYLRPGIKSEIDLYTTAKAIGLRVDKVSHEEQLLAMSKVWAGILWLSKAYVIGARTRAYYERTEKGRREISTRVNEPLILIRRYWTADKMPLPGIMGEVYGERYEALYMNVPRVAILEISEEWSLLVKNTSLSEFLEGFGPVMELSGNQPSGAWARSIALSLASLWRREADQYFDALQDIEMGRSPSARLPKQTRETLIKTFPPTKNPLDKIAGGNDPARAVNYWAQALQLLVQCGFLAPYGDAQSVEEANLRRDSSGTPIDARKGWIVPWSTSTVALMPGPKIVPALQAVLKKDMNK